MRHGVSGYQSGCRCDVCLTSEQQRVQQIAAAEAQRWGPVNKAADERSNEPLDSDNERHVPRQRPRRKHWTEAEVALVTEGKLTDQQIAEQVGRSAEAVKAFRQRRELKLAIQRGDYPHRNSRSRRSHKPGTADGPAQQHGYFFFP
ncbi:hypothetical protein AWB96_00560 [Mycobacteroides chelonae]|nr:hypothetical protein AWB96_00560 [Mycobacteroides chelonae]